MVEAMEITESLFELKMIVLVLALLSGLIGVYAARLGNGSEWRLTMAFLNAFASGVLLAAGLVCMLPDAGEGLCKMCPYVIAGSAILTLILVEEAAMFVASSVETKSIAGVQSSVTSAGEQARSLESGPDTSPSQTVLDLLVQSPGKAGPPSGSSGMSEKLNKLKSSGMHMTKKVGIFGKVAPEKDAMSSGQGASMPLLKDSCGQDCFPAVDMLASVDTETFQQLSCDGAMLISAHGLSTSKAICLFVALSFHSVMEGIGLGTQKHISTLISISAAILAHKGLAAFALGTALCKSTLPPVKIGIMAWVFSCGTPTGIAIGTFVAEHYSGPALSVCTAIAAGTFLQISMMEIIPSALQAGPGETTRTRIARCLFLASGFGMMCLTIYLVGG